jgi:hypothetical protein
MRRYVLIPMFIFALCATVSIGAQSVFVQGNLAGTPVPSQAKPEAVVARLMSFDVDHDGRLTRAELPERMQSIFARADVTKDGALDANEVLRLAEKPAPQVAVRGLQEGHYGFGDENDFDSRLHLDGAIEDLRLASATRDKALGIGHRYLDSVKAKAKADLFATAEPLLNADQFADFKLAITDPGRQAMVTQPLLIPPPVVGPQTPAESQQVRVTLEQLKLTAQRGNLGRLITAYGLSPDATQKMLAAVDRFKAHDHLSDAERSALLTQLRGVLTDQDRDDLRAALERRPIVKQGTNVAFRIVQRVGPPAPPAPQQFGVQDLVLRDRPGTVAR